MKYPLKWSKKEIIERVKAYDNKTLIEEALTLAGGDDYDGGMTNKGAFEYNTLLEELNRRLKEIGFIKEPLQ